MANSVRKTVPEGVETYSRDGRQWPTETRASMTYAIEGVAARQSVKIPEHIWTDINKEGSYLMCADYEAASPDAVKIPFSEFRADCKPG